MAKPIINVKPKTKIKLKSRTRTKQNPNIIIKNKTKTKPKQKLIFKTKSPKTLRRTEPKSNGSRVDLNGWIKITLTGNAFERGYAHGSLLRKEIIEFIAMYEFYMPYLHGRSLDYFVGLTDDFMLPTIRKNYNEFYQEMRGIAQGAGVNVNYIVFLNCCMSVSYLYENLASVLRASGRTLSRKYADAARDANTRQEGAIRRQYADDRCSAFIATGSHTKDGLIVCAHNSFSPYIDGQYGNIIMEIRPKRGFAITMQSYPGYIFSCADFFVTSAGIIGTETTIGGFNKYENRDPICCRIRQCMQYGRTLDEYVSTLLHRNSGDYANSWLFGDINTNEIMRLELGLEYYNVERTRDGVFIGCNTVDDPRIRNLECSKNTWFEDIRHSRGARRVRLTELVNVNRGKLDLVVAAKIIADHYDVYLKKDVLSSRGICKHCEYDDASNSPNPEARPYEMVGATDGAVIDTNSARNMSMILRFGSSCGTPFNAGHMCAKHPQWSHLRPYLKDRPKQPWTKV
jgi:hypothetical protein